MIELGTDAVEREARELAAVSAEFPDMEVKRVFGGWEAYPKGTVITRTVTTTALLRKLREQRDQVPGEPIG